MGYKIDFINYEKNRLKTTWDSAWTIDDAQEYYDTITEEIAKLDGNLWTAIINQTDFRPADPAASELIKETIVKMIDGGMAKAAIITGDRMAKVQMTRIALQAGIQPKLKYVNNEEEARELLGWN